MRILLVEEDGSSNENDEVQKGLKQYGYTIDRLSEGKILLSFIKTEIFEVILFNLNSSEVSKLSVLYKIRAAGITIPVLILTYNQSAQDKIKAFDNGADDYLTKPVDLAELSARIRALQRRYSNNRASPLLTYRDIELNPNSLTVTLKGQDISFSRREFSLLQKLLENVGHVVSRNSLNQCLYGWNDEIDSNALEVHVHNIRKKLGNPHFIRTIRGVGYMVEKENL
ncbi:response regulator transcription factor [Rickettsiella endosymbiont of Xylota segnis]|jgi:two-component system response regulator QseB|uniref:response regulator transcription factor n=1 Tax=Rickettsiella endosymbiont of Xylota segnis TaxID=3066238 RepID=UPI0030CCAF2E